LRRATRIETGLLRMQAETLCTFRSSRPKMAPDPGGEADSSVRPFARQEAWVAARDLDSPINTQESHASATEVPAVTTARAVAVSFLRLANLDDDIVDRLSRYEAAAPAGAGPLYASGGPAQVKVVSKWVYFAKQG
jgi:hypothetical protein